MKQDKLIIGKITSPHGVRGEVKVQALTDDMTRFDVLEQVTIRMNGKEKTYAIQQVRYHKNMVLLTLEGITSKNKADELRNGQIVIPREQGIELEEDRYYIVDLIDMDVFENGVRIGRLKEVLQHGAADLYIIEEEQKDLMLPATKENILNVDLEANRMDVFVPEGLRDL